MTASSTSIGFNYNPLDRRSERRDDHAFIESLRRAPSARFLVFEADIPLLKRGSEHDAWFLASEAATFGEPLHSVFLGQESDGSGRFALGFKLGLEPADPSPGTVHHRVDLRSIAVQGLVSPAVLGMLG